jgi:hypothetical protein
VCGLNEIARLSAYRYKAEHEALLTLTNKLMRDAEAIMARAADVRLQSQQLCTEARWRQTGCPLVLSRVELR